MGGEADREGQYTNTQHINSREGGRPVGFQHGPLVLYDERYGGYYEDKEGGHVDREYHKGYIRRVLWSGEREGKGEGERTKERESEGKGAVRGRSRERNGEIEGERGT
jgi:hypothetical protein